MFIFIIILFHFLLQLLSFVSDSISTWVLLTAIAYMKVYSENIYFVFIINKSYCNKYR